MNPNTEKPAIIKYVCYPERYTTDLSIDARQAELVCIECNNVVKLTPNNSITIPSHTYISHSKRQYHGGRCLKPECETIFLDKQQWKAYDRQFAREEAVLEDRTKAADAKCETLWKKLMSEQEERNKIKDKALSEETIQRIVEEFEAERAQEHKKQNRETMTEEEITREWGFSVPRCGTNVRFG